ncbi:MAG TPA: NAD-dependent epimerase/dehydratase family protein, partial [Patescibacteria group bacterium]
MESMGVNKKNKIKIILVTGGTGFIGSHLVKKLLQKKYSVVVPYIKIEDKSLFATDPIFRQVILEKLNINNKRKVLSIIKKYKIDFIFHLAAETIVQEGYKNPYKTLQTNILGTINLLEAVRLEKKITGIIFASSDKAYGKTNAAYTEESSLKGDHPYDVSKSSADLIAQTFIKTYNTPVIITRFANVYGPGDLHIDRIIPGICEALVKNKKLKIRSNGLYKRDYIYVEDVVDGYLFLLKKFNTLKGQAYNFSSKENLSVLDLIKKIEKISNKKIEYKI